MLNPKQLIRNYRSKKKFLKLEDELLFLLRKQEKIQGNYGAQFNELSCCVSQLIEYLSLRHVDRDKEKEMLRVFSPNKDLFHFASEIGLKTSTYLAFEGKSLEAQERILGKIAGPLQDKTLVNKLFQCEFDLICKVIAEILRIRYPDYKEAFLHLEEELLAYKQK